MTISWIKIKKGLKILIHDKDKQNMFNIINIVVHKEVFHKWFFFLIYSFLPFLYERYLLGYYMIKIPIIFTDQITVFNYRHVLFQIPSIGIYEQMVHASFVMLLLLMCLLILYCVTFISRVNNIFCVNKLQFLIQLNWYNNWFLYNFIYLLIFMPISKQTKFTI